MSVPDNWRDAAMVPTIFGVDSRATIPWLVAIMHVSVMTALVATTVTILFGVLGHMGYSPLDAVGRFFDFLIAQRHRAGRVYRME